MVSSWLLQPASWRGLQRSSSELRAWFPQVGLDERKRRSVSVMRSGSSCGRQRCRDASWWPVGAEINSVVSSSRMQSTSWQGLQRSSSGLRAWSPSHRGPAQERSVSVMRSVAFYQQTHNNALEQTRRVGVPASRAVVGVPPCSSTQCCAGTRAERRCHRK